jgi:serine/threonine-protein kinase
VEGRRRCPICDLVTDERLCPRDKIATLLVDAPGVDVASVYVGQVIADRYVIERKIGRGGFGAVFAAHHTGTGQEVALKCLNTAAGVDDVTLRRFFQEARVTSGLRHPNTIRVFDFGQDDSGLLYLAMELLSGRTLKQELAHRRKENQVFSEQEAIHIGIGILRSLAEAHAVGLVHRDLKPDNIFLHEVTGEEPIIKVLDFGIVKLGDSTITLGSDSGVPGTPAFMSPEQVTRQAVDGRSDLYSLGCLLYQLVSGKVPLRGETAMQTLYMHVHERVVDLRKRAKTPISERFASLVHCALEKDPSDRYRDAKAMRAALEKCLGGSPATRVERDPTRLVRQPSLFTGEIDDSDASVPDISRQHLPRPSAPRLRLALVLAAVFLGVLGFALAALLPIEEPAIEEEPVPIEVAAPDEPAPPAEAEVAPEAAPEPTPAVEPENKPVPRRAIARPKKSARAKPKPKPKKIKKEQPAEPRDEILDQKI